MTEVKYRTSIGDSWHLVRFATEQDAQAWLETKREAEPGLQAIVVVDGAFADRNSA